MNRELVHQQHTPGVLGRQANGAPLGQWSHAVLERILHQREQHHRRQLVSQERVRKLDVVLEAGPEARAMQPEVCGHQRTFLVEGGAWIRSSSIASPVRGSVRSNCRTLARVQLSHDRHHGDRDDDGQDD